MGSEIERVASSIERLYGEGGLSDDAKDSLLAVSGSAAQIADGLGKASLTNGELLLATILVDDSTSIGPLISHVRHGHRLMLEALQPQSGSAAVQVMTRGLNRGLITPFQDLNKAAALTEHNFSGCGQVGKTPLYLQTLLTLGIVMTKAQEEETRGNKVRTYTLIITDGEDRHSGTITVTQVRAVVGDMLEFATNHIVAGMGIGEHHDFATTFRDMGIRSIYTAGVTPQDLEKEFQKISKALRLAASSEVGFRQLAAGASG